MFFFALVPWLHHSDLLLFLFFCMPAQVDCCFCFFQFVFFIFHMPAQVDCCFCFLLLPAWVDFLLRHANVCFLFVLAAHFM